MIKVGVFGVGHLGKFHLNNWKEIPDAEVIGFYDPDDDTSKNVSEKYQLPRFLDVDALLNASDALTLSPRPPIILNCAKKLSKKVSIFSLKSHLPIQWKKPGNW